MKLSTKYSHTGPNSLCQQWEQALHRTAHQSSLHSGLLHTSEYESLQQNKEETPEEQENPEKEGCDSSRVSGCCCPAYGLLTIIEKISEDPDPQITTSEVTWNQDKGMALFKIETLQGNSGISNW